MPKEKSVEELFAKLQVFSAKDEHEGVLDCATRILAKDKSNKSAQRSRIVALVKLDRFAGATKDFEANESLRQELPVAYAYCLYKLDRLDTLRAFAKTNTQNRGVQHCLAQALYRADEYSVVDGVYNGLEATVQASGVPGEDFDIHINKSAVVAQKALSGALTSESLSVPAPASVSSYDEMFNIGTAYIGLGDYENALQWLREAKMTCSGSSDLSAAEIAAEEFSILTQAAYTHQLAGQAVEAVDILEGDNVNATSNSAPVDGSVRQVAVNNLISLKKEAYLENANVALRALDECGPSDILAKKQISRQTAVIQANRLLLMKVIGRDISSMASNYSQLHPGKAGVQADALLASLGVSDSSVGVKIKNLSAFLKKNPTNIIAALTLAQLYNSESKVDSAAQVLEGTHKALKSDSEKSGDAFLPGLVGALVAIFRIQGREPAVTDLLAQSIKHWSSLTSTGSIDNLIRVAAAALATSEIQTHRQIAQEQFRKLYQADPENLTNIAGSIATDDNTTGESDKLEAVETLVSGIDAERLNEDGVYPLITQKRKAPSASTAAQPKKKRSRRLPKDYDESKTPDPERWIPLRDRSTYKPKRKDKKNMAKSTQGGISDSTTETAQAAPASTVKTSKQSSKQQQKKKGKKKGKK